ncbi:hypothetical protein [Aquibacillus saliphilus]|uniref:hypothetical protein n=1 Tax=Aquibacillus saliphilus TaxID=1909422 RepID=UPI001CF093D6|nr:hypothetical protein [Aquibacillus saliphilus]
MRDFDDLNKLLRYVEEQSAEVMENDVSHNVKQLQSQHVKTDVYDAYTGQDPYMDRRGYNGGLADTRNMIHTVTNTINGIELFIKNVTGGNESVYKTGATNPPDYLAGIIENGRNNGRYMTNKTGTQNQYLNARPFISNTIEELQNTLQHIDWYKRGMKRRGIDLE